MGAAGGPAAFGALAAGAGYGAAWLAVAVTTLLSAASCGWRPQADARIRAIGGSANFGV